jgi:hypothetical protein
MASVGAGDDTNKAQAEQTALIWFLQSLRCRSPELSRETSAKLDVVAIIA